MRWPYTSTVPRKERTGVSRWFKQGWGGGRGQHVQHKKQLGSNRSCQDFPHYVNIASSWPRITWYSLRQQTHEPPPLYPSRMWYSGMSAQPPEEQKNHLGWKRSNARIWAMITPPSLLCSLDVFLLNVQTNDLIMMYTLSHVRGSVCVSTLLCHFSSSSSYYGTVIVACQPAGSWYGIVSCFVFNILV